MEDGINGLTHILKMLEWSDKVSNHDAFGTPQILKGGLYEPNEHPPPLYGPEDAQVSKKRSTTWDIYSY